MRICAVVLAGAKNKGKLKDCCDSRYEAEIPVGGVPMVRYVVDALVASSSVSEVVVVGPTDLLSRALGRSLPIVPGGDTMVKTLCAGLAAAGDADRVLVVTSDVPLLTPEAVDGLVALCGDCTADFYYPIIPRRLLDTQYPGTRRTYVSLREGEFTGGNVVLLNPQVLAERIELVDEFVRARKSPLRLAGLLGLSFVWRFFTGGLTVPALERKLSDLFGVDARAVVCPYAAVGIDVDKPADLDLVCRAMVAAVPADIRQGG